MKVFVAGATGAIGRKLVPLLVESGHEVTALTRSEHKAQTLGAAGATPVIGDALERESLIALVREARPQAVIHQLTAIGSLDMRHFDRDFEPTNRLRTEGTDNLLAAARAAGARRFLAQSFGGWPYAQQGGPVKSEEDPLDPEPPAAMRETLAAIRRLERAVGEAQDLEGIVLRYGGFYGPGTGIGADGDIVAAVRARKFPLVGDGAGVWSFVHVDDAAAATVAALERGKPGVYNVTDDEPAPVMDWLPVLAEAVGAKPPRHVPTWLGRLAAGDAAVRMMTRIRGASNAKAKWELGWQLRYPSWREGFRSGLT